MLRLVSGIVCPIHYRIVWAFLFTCTRRVARRAVVVVVTVRLSGARRRKAAARKCTGNFKMLLDLIFVCLFQHSSFLHYNLDE